MSTSEPTFEQVARACGSSSHKPDEPVTPPELADALAELHPVVVSKFVRRWAEARDERGESSAEHSHFRSDIEDVLERWSNDSAQEDDARSDERSGPDDAERMMGTGRANLTGGAATITMPKGVVEKFDIDENGRDVVWFERGPRLFVVPRSAVTVREPVGGNDEERTRTGKEGE